MADNIHMNKGSNGFPETADGRPYSDPDGKTTDPGGKERGEGAGIHDAMLQIEMLFQSPLLSYGFKEYSIENFVDKKYFYSWKGKEGCSDTDAMRQGLRIDAILEKSDPSKNEVLTYLQYTLNIAELCRRNFNSEEMVGYFFDLRSYTTLLTRIRELLARLRYDVKYVAEKEVIYLVTKNVATDAVTDISSDPITDAIVEYNSYSVAGDLDRKKKILNDMGDMVESYTDNLSPGNVKLYSNIEFMLYNFNIRNNNLDGKDRVDYVAAMSKEELEAWYDETYQMLLLRILQHENLERMKRVDAVQQACEATSVESVSKDMVNEGADRVMSRRRVEDLNFVAQNVAEAASVANSLPRADSIRSDKEKKAGERARRAEEKARESMRAVREKELPLITETDLDKDVKSILSETEAEKPKKKTETVDSSPPRNKKKKGYTPSFRDVSDTASTAVSHENDNSASFVKKSKDAETEKWDAEYSERRKAWAESEGTEDWKMSGTLSESKREGKPKSPLKILLTVLLLFLIAAFAGFISLVHFNYARSHYVSDKQIPVNTDSEMIETYVGETGVEDAAAMLLREQTEEEISAEASTIDKSRMFNVLLACSKDIGSESYAPCDAIILVSFNKNERRLTSISLMPNLYADIDEAGAVRLGDVPLYGGMPALVSVVTETYGLPVNAYAWTDYRGMIKLIDRVGGVDAEISEAEMRLANGYVNEMAEEFGADTSAHQLRMSGDVHLDGYQAVAYARISESHEADYAKAARQRKVLNEVTAAYEKAGFAEKTAIIREILPSITHNLSESAVYGNLSVVNSAKNYSKAGLSLPLDGHYRTEGNLIVPAFTETLPILKQILSDKDADYALSLLTENGVYNGTETTEANQTEDSGISSEGPADSGAGAQADSADSVDQSEDVSGSQNADTGPQITPEMPWSWTI